jgi:hypothetical protein
MFFDTAGKNSSILNGIQCNLLYLTSRTPQQTIAQGTTSKYGPVLLTQSYHEKDAEITIRHYEQKLFLRRSRYPTSVGTAIFVLRIELNIT